MTPRPSLTLLFDLFAADQAAAALLAPAMAGTGLTASQYAEYSVVVVEGPLSVTRFAEVTRLPLTTASDTLRAMERRGHLARQRDPADGRAWLLDLTDDGRAAHGSARAAFRRASRRVSAALGEDEERVREALRLLADACAAAADDDGPRPTVGRGPS